MIRYEVATHQIQEKGISNCLLIILSFFQNCLVKTPKAASIFIETAFVILFKKIENTEGGQAPNS